MPADTDARPRAPRSFHYWADPVCLGAIAVYLLNRWYLRPHALGGLLIHDYLNDLLCLPLFTPVILYLQRLLGLRRHDGYPRLWEIIHHCAVFAISFELVLPRFPKYFHSVADPRDVLAYVTGGLGAAIVWGALRTRSPCERPHVRRTLEAPIAD